MKYSILINQAGIVGAGLHTSTDLVDWALLGYIADWQIHSGAKRMNDHVWLNYKHVISEMPLMGLNRKNSISDRIKKLVKTGLITTSHDDDFCVYVKTTMLYSSAVNFRPDIVKIPVRHDEHPVRHDEHPVRHDEHPVRHDEHPVRHDEHSINNQLINNQDQKARESKCAQEKTENGFEKFWAEYPKKKSKDAAKKAWMKLNPDEQLQLAIIAAVLWAKTQDIDWLKDNGQFVPFPATYLNGRRWEDEINAQKSPGDRTSQNQGFANNKRGHYDTKKQPLGKNSDFAEKYAGLFQSANNDR